MITMTKGSMLTKEYDKQVNDLMFHALDFSFDKWHAKGVWNDDYERYSIIENQIMLAHVGVYKMKMLIDGEQKDFLQIGGVATREECRCKGLSRSIFEHVFTKYPDTFVFLHGGNSVINFYPKFGFKPFEEKQPYIEYKLDSQGDMIKLNMNDPKVDKYLRKRNQYSRVIDCLNQYEINWFHLLYRHQNDIYEIPQLDLMIIARQNGNKLTIFDIAASKPVTFEEILHHLNFQGVDTIHFGFIPDWLGVNYSMKEYLIDDSNPFVRGDFGIEGEFMIPKFITT